MSPAQVAYWDQVWAKLAQDAEWRKSLEANSWENTYMSSGDTRRYLDEQHAQFKSALADIGLAK